ncbi:MAG TPA: type VI secretion system membrane subunit TssM [Geminicoccaceae bacterium]|nr:type VI secretion system membrane subunit TssM [Geminicoccaceae bacterium]
MRVLKSLVRILTSRWFLTGLGAALIAALVWFFGELLAIGGTAPFETELVRGLTVAGIAVLWLVSNLVADLRARRRNTALVQELAAPPPQAGPADAEIAELQQRFKEALDRLKGQRFQGARGSRWLGQLPWYLLIGPPGSGKTTALLQSGLRFPLRAGAGAELRGVGGTRNCDWFFTDEAVLIDTAGRYTTQDSDARADQAAWDGFLDLLRRHRGRLAVNGVLVAIGVDELLRAGEGGLQAHARAIRARLNELSERLKVRFPVYLLVTKADLVAGFEPSFADLGEAEREQVWGFTLPLAKSEDRTAELAMVEPELDLLIERVSGRVLDRLAAERDLERRRLILDFPAQLAALKPILTRFVQRLFEPSQYEPPQLLRGVYLTSGTQEGTPIDRLMAAMAQSFGVAAPPPATASPGRRSFFLTRLLKNVVFGEAGLVVREPDTERRERWVRQLAWTGAGIAVLGSAALFGWAYLGARNETQAMARALVTAAGTSEPVARTELPMTEQALAPVLPALEAFEALPVPAAWGAGGMVPGLAVGGELEQTRDSTYRRGLLRLLLPRLVLRLEDQLRANITDPDFVLEGLKTYLMLTGRAPVDQAHLAAWYGTIDPFAEPGLGPEEQRRALAHVDALRPLLETTAERPEADGDLLFRTRETLANLPLERRAYAALLALPEVQALPPWRPADAAGPGAAAVLIRRSGRPLNEPIPGVFTRAAFHEVVLPALDDLATGVAVEGWVLGSAQDGARAEAEQAQLKGNILKLYYDDYVATWEQLLRDVGPIQLEGLRQSVEVLKTLAGPSSPLKALLAAVVEETRLTQPPAGQEAAAAGVDPAVAAAAAKKVGTKLGGKLGGQAAQLAARILQAPAAGPAEPPGLPVEQRFRYLAELVEGVGGAPPALDEAMQALQGLQGELQQVVASPNPEEELKRRGGLGAVAAPIAQAAGRLPAPLGDWLGGVAQRAQGYGVAAIQSRINARWQADVLPVCRKALGGRFPFDGGSGVDVSLADFSRLFAPGGLIDQFVSQELAPLVDMARRPWRWQTPSGMPDSSLVPFEQARQIRDSLFAAGAQPGASFTLKPSALDAGAQRVVLDLDGQQVSYAHGPAQPARLAWPGPQGTNLVRLTFVPLGGGAPAVVAKEGAWSWFRLLKDGQFRGTDLPDLFEVVLPAAGHEARFELRAGSVYNPFDLRLLERFRCPERL